MGCTTCCPASGACQDRAASRLRLARPWSRNPTRTTTHSSPASSRRSGSSRDRRASRSSHPAPPGQRVRTTGTESHPEPASVSALEWPLGAIELKVLDLERVVAFYEWFGLPRFTGGARDASKAFYGSVGMELMAQAGHVMRFLSWGGYHHPLGINLLEGRDAAAVEPGVRGLRSFEIRRLEVARTDPNGILLTPPL